jgi:hypothetical protein
MPSAGFESTIPVIEQPLTYTSDRTAFVKYARNTIFK